MLRISRRFSASAKPYISASLRFSDSPPCEISSKAQKAVVVDEVNHRLCDNQVEKLKLEPELESESESESVLSKLKKERNPDTLFRLFKENATRRRVIENRYAYEDTVTRLAGAGRFDYIEDLLEEQKALPQGRSEGFVVRVIMLYGRAGMIRQAVDTFYGMSCEKRSVMSLNATLKVLSKGKDLEVISKFVREASEKFGIRLDVVSVNIVVSAFCEVGMLDKAYLLVVEMEKEGIKPNVVTYTTLISGFYKCGRWVIGNGLWNLMIWKGCYPNVATFNARIQFLVGRRRPWEANSMLLLMEELEMTPNEVTYNLVLKGFFKARRVDMAKRVWSAMHDRGYEANKWICQTMVHYLCVGGDFSSAYNLCKKCMKNNWFVNVDTICRLIRGLKSIGQVDKAWMIIGLADKRCPPFPVKQMVVFKSLLGKD